MTAGKLCKWIFGLDDEASCRLWICWYHQSVLGDDALYEWFSTSVVQITKLAPLLLPIDESAAIYRIEYTSLLLHDFKAGFCTGSSLAAEVLGDEECKKRWRGYGFSWRRVSAFIIIIDSYYWQSNPISSDGSDI
ncbi:hypothetical protein Bca4012_083598 [Brassica carinata]